MHLTQPTPRPPHPIFPATCHVTHRIAPSTRCHPMPSDLTAGFYTRSASHRVFSFDGCCDGRVAGEEGGIVHRLDQLRGTELGMGWVDVLVPCKHLPIRAHRNNLCGAVYRPRPTLADLTPPPCRTKSRSEQRSSTLMRERSPSPQCTNLCSGLTSQVSVGWRGTGGEEWGVGRGVEWRVERGGVEWRGVE